MRRAAEIIYAGLPDKIEKALDYGYTAIQPDVFPLLRRRDEWQAFRFAHPEILCFPAIRWDGPMRDGPTPSRDGTLGRLHEDWVSHVMGRGLACRDTAGAIIGGAETEALYAFHEDRVPESVASHVVALLSGLHADRLVDGVQTVGVLADPPAGLPIPKNWLGRPDPGRLKKAWGRGLTACSDALHGVFGSGFVVGYKAVQIASEGPLALQTGFVEAVLDGGNAVANGAQPMNLRALDPGFYGRLLIGPVSARIDQDGCTFVKVAGVWAVYDHGSRRGRVFTVMP